MRIEQNTIDQLRAAIAPLDTAERRAVYRSGDFPRAELVTDLDKRYRWDLYWLVPTELQHEISGSGVLDVHIDTALRRIVDPL